MSIKKYMITICGENPPSLDEVHEAIAKITKDYFSTWEEAKKDLRIRKEIEE